MTVSKMTRGTGNPAHDPIGDGRRIVALDGLRGLAALAVVVAHFFGEVEHGFSFLMVGWAGVWMFFILSGYLMGSIIMGNVGRPGFFKVFAIRRGMRILPIYYVILGVTLLVAAFLLPGVETEGPLISPAGYFSFLHNIEMALKDSYGHPWLLPTWTLAVEMQFYLVLPVLLAAVPRRYYLAVILGAVLLAPVIRGGMLVFGLTENHLAGLVLLPARMDLLGLGVLAAYIGRYHGEALARHFVTVRLVVPLAMAAGIAIALMDLFIFSPRKIAFFVAAPLVIGTGLAAYMMLILQGAPEARRWNSAFWRFFGNISYCLYLIHQPVNGMLHEAIFGTRPDIATPAQFAVTVFAVGLSIGLSYVSWLWLESRCLAFARRWRYPAGVGAAHTEMRRQEA